MYRKPVQTPAVTQNKRNTFVDDPQDNGFRVHGKWESRQVKNLGRFKKPGLVIPEKRYHNIKPLNLLSKMSNETSVNYETESKMDAIEQKHKDAIDAIQMSHNRVINCVTFHYENLIKKQNELVSNEKLSLQLRNVATNIASNDFTLLAAFADETRQLFEEINLAFARHTIMIASKCTVV
ncbi:hypothetical protein RFI_03834, partial [Reticulomyxa filosa]